jgi:hypothetical protein
MLAQGESHGRRKSRHRCSRPQFRKRTRQHFLRDFEHIAAEVFQLKRAIRVFPKDKNSNLPILDCGYQKTDNEDLSMAV